MIFISEKPIFCMNSKPYWLKVKASYSKEFVELKQRVREKSLHTVCEEAHCPNQNECWSLGTATFMILGDTCTRGCKFCNVKTARLGNLIDEEEPEKLSKAVKEMRLSYAVITSVDRDDLKDQGAIHWSKVVKELKKISGLKVEALIPDFRGEFSLVKKIIDSGIDVLAHNIETVERLQNRVRDPRANYQQSLKVLREAKEYKKELPTKSSIMLGLGEREEEVLQCMKDLRSAGVDFLTLGQYLQPSAKHFPVQEFVEPKKFAFYKERALEQGFAYCASGPFVRSSYKAGEYFQQVKE